MKISATVKSRANAHHVAVETNGISKSVAIPQKLNGQGSSINGGELLLLALATCFCNDLYREAAKRKIDVSSVDVTCKGEFNAEGEAGSNFSYEAHVVAEAPDDVIRELIAHTDRVTEIQKTVRGGASISLNV